MVDPLGGEIVHPPGRVALVPARYGAGLVGGAEIVLREMAAGLAGRGWDVEVLTSCALDHFSWQNVYPPGVTKEDGLVIRRFPAVVSTPGSTRAGLERAILAGNRLGLDDQQRWMNDGMRMPELFHYLLDTGRDYRAVIFTPYPFWTTFACSQVVPDRSVLWTCLHDEPYAYLDIFRPVFSGVAGLLFQTAPEHQLAHRIAEPLAPHAEVGCGVPIPASYDPDRFRRRHGVDGRFLLYAGRREGAKGWEDLLRDFEWATQRYDLPFSLVTMGGGPVNPPPGLAGRVIDLGFLSDSDRDDAFAAADAYLQPSRWEAFSRTIMEAWLAGTPVIANGGSEVVRWHCERSRAGLVYDDRYEFAESLAFVAVAPDAARAMAVPGRSYVLENYLWESVLDRVEKALQTWTAGP